MLFLLLELLIISESKSISFWRCVIFVLVSFLCKYLIIKQLGCQISRINWRISDADSRIWSLEIQGVSVGLGNLYFFFSYSCDSDVRSSLGTSHSLCNSLTYILRLAFGLHRRCWDVVLDVQYFWWRQFYSVVRLERSDWP